MIHIGTCGYSRYQPGGDWKAQYADKLQAYADRYPAVELNRTFYKLPMARTAAKWREEVPESFDFTVKVWQAVTHPTSSVTWRKRKEKLSDEEREGFGNLQPVPVTMEAWERTMEIVDALRASVCVVQTPAGFGPTEEHVENLRAFFTKVDRHGAAVAWEPRGEWNESLDLVEDVCRDLDLIHIVDPFRRDPRTRGGTAYLRLHGRNPKETDYHYSYDRPEIEELARKVRALHADHDRVYCMFNNDDMYANAAMLQEILATGE